jgi:hypothetical protein
MVEAPHHWRQPAQAVKAQLALAFVDRLAQRPPRYPKKLSDARFRDNVYLYVHEISKSWVFRPPKLTLLYGFSGYLKSDKNGDVSPKEAIFQSIRRNHHATTQTLLRHPLRFGFE